MTLHEASFDAVSTMTAARMFDRRVEETPDVVAIRTVAGDLTFGTWRRRSWSMRALLGTVGGVQRGDRIAMWMSNDDARAYVTAFQAVLDAGGIVVGLDDRLAIPEARGVLREAEPRALLIAPVVARRLGEEGLAELGVRRIDEPALSGEVVVVPIAGERAAGDAVGWDGELATAEPGPSPATPSDEAMIAYTSGSTGRPKGALWTNAALCQYAERVSNAIYADPRGGASLGPRDVLQSPIPLYTAASVIENLYPAMYAGCLLVYEGRRFDARASEERMTANETTVYNGVPPHYALMCELPTKSAARGPELMVTSGSAFTPDLYLRMRTRWPRATIANWYGLNESGTGQTLNHGADIERAPSSIGRPIWPTEIRIVDADGVTLGAGEAGELWMRAPGQMPGYFRNPEQTAERLHEGWLRTGDRAVIDADGLIHVIGRSEERINRGGFKFYPGEIESALEDHPAVREAGVVAVPHPVLGEDHVAVVVAASGVEEAELRAWCRERIAPNKVPSRILFADSLPRGAYGKIVRRELRRVVDELRPNGV